MWGGELWKDGFGGAVADLGLLISGSRRRPRRSQLRGQLRHDRSHQLAEGDLRRPFSPAFSGWFSWPLTRWSQVRGQLGRARSEQLAEGGYGVLSLRHFRAGSLYPLIAWRVGAEESGAAK